MKDIIKYLPELVLIIVAFSGVFISTIPVLYVSLLFFVVMLFRLNIVEIIYMCNMVLSSMLGSLFYTIGIGGIGGFIYLLGTGLLIIGYLSHNIKFKNISNALIPLVLMVMYLYFSVQTSSGGDVALSKLVHTFIIGFVSVLAFGTLFNNIEKVRTTLLSLYLLIASILTMGIAIKVNGISGPSSVFDIGFLRFQTSMNDIFKEIGDFRISYHLPGTIALQALGVFFMRDKYCKKLNLVAFLILCFLPVLYSGARQSTVIIFVMLLLGWRLNEQIFIRSSIKKFISTAMIVVFIVMIISALVGNVFATIAEEGLYRGSGRMDDYIRAFNNFQSNPLFGIGYGRDNVLGDYNQYAHNIFFELLGELGLLGLLFFTTIFWHYYKKSRRTINSWIILFLAILGPALFSNGFDINIKVFTFFFASPYLLLQTHYSHKQKIRKI